MSHGLYSIVRCVPNTMVGEFINVGVIVLDTVSGEWGFRQVRNYDHLKLLAKGNEVQWVQDFFDSLPTKPIEYAPKAGTDTERASNWLVALDGSLRSVIQLSKPLPNRFENIEDEINSCFKMFVIED